MRCPDIGGIPKITPADVERRPRRAHEVVRNNLGFTARTVVVCLKRSIARPGGDVQDADVFIRRCVLVGANRQTPRLGSTVESPVGGIQRDAGRIADSIPRPSATVVVQQQCTTLVDRESTGVKNPANVADLEKALPNHDVACEGTHTVEVHVADSLFDEGSCPIQRTTEGVIGRIIRCEHSTCIDANRALPPNAAINDADRLCLPRSDLKDGGRSTHDTNPSRITNRIPASHAKSTFLNVNRTKTIVRTGKQQLTITRL